MPSFLTAALYKFVTLPDFTALQTPLQAFCEAQDVRGTLLLAEEGINGTIAGPEDGVRAVLAHLRSDPRLAGLAHKESWSLKLPFYRMKVRLKREIVTLGVPGINPNQMAGQYVKPQDWNALISEAGVVVVDTRNNYEVGIGTFAGAVDPHTKSFSELPAWVAAQSAPGGLLAEKNGKKPKVAMFCTGGIRCEKSTAFMRTQGFDEVYHLEGGILKYLETVPEDQSRWQGECFVFDERVSVVHGLATGHYDLCRACRDPISAADKASPLYVPGVSCPGCHDKKTDAQKRGFIERQRQVDYANRQRQPHIGAKLASSSGETSEDGEESA
ncbi:MAG: rhodanese-related sulfurtransferase [Polaromonas sp.]|uniref:oxygen-dependent tRNA uridine(34) hydroxylase TrhO n=1 Tax=Polaromonas sp. TaxID=1869339 RepID=UPI002734463E|nr:rhodanese-related sulfurtransferase [Polaromonas sp.]MDP2817063.1 rhodanese-related sulfurtransferase [Polaromonas sp.]